MALFSIVLFIVAMVFGLFILSAILKKTPTPKPIVVFHGSFAAIALLVLIAYIVAGHSSPLILTSLALLLIAALGGFILMALDLSKKTPPVVMALLHAGLALSGVILLIVYIFQILST